jgi:hypothetical protein
MRLRGSKLVNRKAWLGTSGVYGSLVQLLKMVQSQIRPQGGTASHVSFTDQNTTEHTI